MFGKPQLQCDYESRLSALPCSGEGKMKHPTPHSPGALRPWAAPAPGAALTMALHTMCIPTAKLGAPHLPPKVNTLLQDLAGSRCSW